jgi:hypothetical protein
MISGLLDRLTSRRIGTIPVRCPGKASGQKIGSAPGQLTAVIESTRHRASVYRNASWAAALPWNQRLEQCGAVRVSELQRPAACLKIRPKSRTVSTQ